MSAKVLRGIAREIESQVSRDPGLQRIADEVMDQAEVADALRGDRVVYRIVVVALGIVAFTAVLGAVLMILLEKTTDAGALAIVTALGSASIGAIAGLLAPSPTSGGN